MNSGRVLLAEHEQAAIAAFVLREKAERFLLPGEQKLAKKLLEEADISVGI